MDRLQGCRSPLPLSLTHSREGAAPGAIAELRGRGRVVWQPGLPGSAEVAGELDDQLVDAAHQSSRGQQGGAVVWLGCAGGVGLRGVDEVVGGGDGSVLATLQHLAQRVEVEPHDPLSYPPDVLADDGLALIDWLGLDDYDLGGYSLGGRIVLRMLVRGARPTRAIVAGQGLDAINRATSRNGQYRRVLTALVNRDTIEPGSPDEETAHWITQSGGAQALLHILDTLVATPDAALCHVATRSPGRSSQPRSWPSSNHSHEPTS
jgi:pimeloyl-ACP methyl ester carboxylesterase